MVVTCMELVTVMCVLAFVSQTIVPSTLQLSAMAAQMLMISPALSLISAMVRNKIRSISLKIFCWLLVVYFD